MAIQDSPLRQERERQNQLNAKRWRFKLDKSTVINSFTYEVNDETTVAVPPGG